jgi:predicted Zn-dependent protease
MEIEHEFIEQVADEMQRHPDVHDWSIRFVDDSSRQVFATNEHIDERREVNNKKLTAHIFHDLPRENGGSQLRGSASFTLVPSPTPRIDAQHMLAQSLVMAKAAGNPFYALPLPPAQGYPTVENCDKEILEHPQESLEKLITAITDTVSKEAQIIASSTELFATTSTIHFQNSRGIDATTQKTSIILEVILISSDGANDAEHYILTSRCRISDLHVEELIRRNAQFARDSLKASIPKTHKGQVIITGEALEDLFSPLIYHSSAQTVYRSLSRLRIGEPISATGASANGTALTLSSSRILPFGVETLAFDREGIPAMHTEIIRDGVMQQYWANQRYAQYLGIPVTGEFGNIIMAAGKEPYDALRSEDPTYEIVAFSWMNPDSQTGDFVAEIKLGYLYSHGSKIPIKGGSVSGNVFSAFGNFSASSETQFTGSFSGPLALRFEDLTISGQ